MLRIVADENIPYVEQAFDDLGSVKCYPGRRMTADLLADANVLLVRSITPVGHDLLQNTPVQFVGTATIGAEHIDHAYLQRRNIAFADAAGSNADSVAQYLSTTLLTLAQRFSLQLAGKTIGIIGVGNIGARIEKIAQTLAMTALPNDPPLQRRSDDSRFVSLNDALHADFVTLHVPLTRGGHDPTYHLLNENNLPLCTPRTFLINTARGPVVDNHALKAHLQAQQLGPTVLDVWENEPNIDPDLLDLVTISTPHIAGYSLDGKVNGAVMLHRALCRWLNRPDNLQASDLLPPPIIPSIELDTTDAPDELLIAQACTAIYNIMHDDAQMRHLAQLPPQQHAMYFDQLRKNYPVRREAANTHVKLNPPRPTLARKLAALGFQID